MSKPAHTPTGGDPQFADFLHSSEPRRGFLSKGLALVLGGLVGVFPALVGIATFLNPLRKSVRDKQRPSGSDDEGYFRVAPLDGLTVVPQSFKIIADRRDAWNVYPKEAIGAVFLQKMADGEVRAFNVSCPHAGCSVDYRNDAYHCPCHNSSFDLDGACHPKSPSPRPLDALDSKVVENVVWVKFQNFKAGVAEKKAV